MTSDDRAAAWGLATFVRVQRLEEPVGLFRFDRGSLGAQGSQQPAGSADDGPSVDRVRKAIKDANVKIVDLEIEVLGGVARIEGKVRRGDDAEIAILVTGNLAGVSAVDDQLDIEERGRPSRFHTVRPGEDVLTIADQFYGSPRHASAILQANRSILRTADDVRPGIVLRIPHEDKVLA
jgi:nucleoid-associated protein YgaU